MFDIRPATDRDSSQIDSFLEIVRQVSNERRGALDFLEGSYLVSHLDEVGVNPDLLVLLCQRGEDVLGIAALHFRHEHTQVRSHLEIFCSDESDDLANVNQQFIEFAEVMTRSRGVRELDVVSLPGDQSLKSSLEVRGYRARLLVMHRTL